MQARLRRRVVLVSPGPEEGILRLARRRPADLYHGKEG